MTLLYNRNEMKARRRELRSCMTPEEIKLWKALKGKQFDGHKFRRQPSIGHYCPDFYCPRLRLAIEVDGGQHDHWEIAGNDAARTEFLSAVKIRVWRVTNERIRHEFTGVLRELKQVVGSMNP